MTLEFILRICLNTTPVLYSPVLISEFHRPGILGFACVLLLRGLLPFCNNITDLRTRNIGFTIKMVTKYKKSLSSRVCVCVWPSGFPEDSAQGLCQWGHQNKGRNRTDQFSSCLCPGSADSEIPLLWMKHQNQQPAIQRQTRLLA